MRPTLESVLARLVELTGADDHEAITRLHSSDPDAACGPCIELLASCEPDPNWMTVVHDALSTRSGQLLAAARRRGLRYWDATSELPARSWSTRPLADAFADDAGLLEALAPPGRLDAPSSQAGRLLREVLAVEGGDTSVATRAMPRRGESSYRGPAARVFAQLFFAGALTVVDLAVAARRGWVGGSWAEGVVAALPELTDTLLSAALDASVGPVLWHGEVWHADDLTGWLVGQAGERRIAAAVPVLGFLFAARDRLTGDQAGEALAAIATPEAQAALASALDDSLDADWPAHTWRARLSLRGALALEPARGATTLGHLFTPEALSSERGLRRASRVLDLRSGRGPREPLFEHDPGWLVVAAKLLEGPLFGVAREFLATYAVDRVELALREVGYEAPVPSPTPAPAMSGAMRWLQRYEGGEHEAVWAEIAALEVIAGAARDQATQVADVMMKRVRMRLERIVAELTDDGYEFAAPPIADPDPDTVDEIESVLGRPLPLALRAFYSCVGAVDLTARDSQASDPGEDPLMILAPREITRDLHAQHAREQRHVPRLRRPIAATMLGLDPATKAKPMERNSEPYWITLSQGADAVVVQGSRRWSFVGLLREAIAHRGFVLRDSARRSTRPGAISPPRHSF